MKAVEITIKYGEKDITLPVVLILGIPLFMNGLVYFIEDLIQIMIWIRSLL